MILHHADTADPPIREIAVGDDVFRTIDAGAGAPVLFLHGAPGDLRTWLPHCRRLSGRFRCLAYTQRYFGTGPWRADGPPFGTATHAGDLIAFAAALRAGPVAVVAWSYAGHTALHAALMRPDLFSRLLVFEPGVPTYVTDPGERDAFARSAGEMFSPVLEAVNGGDHEEAVRRLIDASGSGGGAFEGLSPERRAVAIDNAPVMARLFTQAPPPPITCEDLGQMQVPVTIRWGASSKPVFAIPSRAAAQCLAAGSHGEIAGVGHLWPEDDPDGFAAMVEDWLDRPA